MLRLSALIFAVFSILFGTTFALGKVYPDIIQVDQIRPGMRGYGLTVFRGTQPEKFDVEVIDVLHSFRPDQDLILIRAKHRVLELAEAVAGMSGSPIFLDGKLAGAYAYGWSFSKEPVTGVTPAINMMAELHRPIDPDIWRFLGNLPEKKASTTPTNGRQKKRDFAGIPAYLGTEHKGAFGTLKQYAKARPWKSSNVYSAAGRLDKVATPILISGMEGDVVQTLGEQLERFGLIALQTGGAGARPSKNKSSHRVRFVNGSAIGVQLIRGDISATAIGTVTYVSDQRLVAFGHPMMNIGQIAWPTATARVLHVLASQMRSFKIAETVAPLGTLIHDRQAAIVVDTSVTADTIPLTVRVHGIESASRQKWQMEIVSHRLLTPSLAFAAIANAVNSSVSDKSHLTYRARSRVQIEEHGTIEMQDVGYTAFGMSDPMALSDLRLFDLIDIAYGNPFKESRIRNIEVDLYLDYKRNVMTIVDAFISQNEVDPGYPINLYVTLRKYARQEMVRIFQVDIPKSAAGKEIEIVVESGRSVRLEQPIPENLSDLVNNLRQVYSSSSIVVSTKLPNLGLKMLGHVVDRLPGSAYDTLQILNQSERARSFITHQHKEMPMGMVISGSARVKLKVRELARGQ